MLLDAELARLEALPAPDGTDEAVFSALKAELAHMLESQGVEKFVSAPPMSAGSGAQLSWDDDITALRWGYCCLGDYNQNSLVEVADITPLGVNWQEQSTDFPAAFPYSAELAVVDGNSNGLIEIADITPIGQNLQARVQAYNVYASDSLSDYPSDAADSNGDATLLGSVPFPEGPSPAGQRRMFSFAVSDPQPETYFWVRPTDGSSEGMPSNYYLLGTGENEPPVAELTADPLLGDIPMTVTLDASTSHDPDGEIVKFEWDWDGTDNGWEWYDSGTESIQLHEYTEIATYTPTVRVTDSNGETRTASIQVWATLPGNDPPVAVLTADPELGDPPLEVSFSAADSFDIDGSIVDYQWDLDGDGTYSEDGDETAFRLSETAVRTFTEIGYPVVNVRVVDDQGVSSVATVQLDIGNFPPVAALTADPYAGNAPMTVNFSAEGSTDEDGSIENYEWDFDGDGVFSEGGGEDDAEGNATASFTFDARGEYDATVRLTDNEGATATAQQLITVTGPGWEVVTVDADGGKNPWLAIISGHPTIAYCKDNQVFYVRAATPVGASQLDWSSKLQLSNQGGEDYQADLPVLAEIAGFPTLAYAANQSTQVIYVQATAAAGSDLADWEQRVTLLDAEIALGFGQFLTVEGNPALCLQKGISIWYARAGTASGSAVEDWEFVPVYLDHCSHNPSMAMVQGHPAIAFRDSCCGHLKYVRSSTSTGLSVEDWSNVVTANDSVAPEWPILAEIDGFPAITWRNYDVIYQRSLTPLGGDDLDWHNEITVFPHEETAAFSTLREIDGHPAIAFLDLDNEVLVYTRADTSDGLDENDWTQFDVVADPASDHWLNTLSMTIVDGNPAIAFKAQDELKYAYFNPDPH